MSDVAGMIEDVEVMAVLVPQVRTVDVPVPQVMTQEVFKQVPVPVTTR